MRSLLLLSALLATGCATLQFGVDPFDRAPEFAADRARETTVLRDMTVESAALLVTETLMDLDCSFVEIDGAAGLVSARASLKSVSPGEGLPMFAIPTSRPKLSCFGTRVTVGVRPRGDDALVRASFDPPDPMHDVTFRTLLRRSVEAKEAGR